MSKFGEFEVVRTERRLCKRPNDPNADEEGMREYAYLKCPHCATDNIGIALSSMNIQKFAVIRDHIRSCPSFVGERPSKRGKSTAIDELLEIKAEMEEMKRQNVERQTVENDSLRAEVEQLKLAMEVQEQAQKRAMETQKQAMEDQQQEIKALQSKTSLYDNVLTAVMPSLVLPLTAPEKHAELCLREAAMRDIRPPPLALPAPADVVTKEMYVAMVEQKDALLEEKDKQIATERAHKEESVSTYKTQLEAKERELSKMEEQKGDAERERKEAEQARKEAEQKRHDAEQRLKEVDARLGKLQRERDVLKTKYSESMRDIKDKQGPAKEGSLAVPSWVRQDPNQARARETAEAIRVEQEFARKRARSERCE